MNKDYEYRAGYMDDTELRHALNRLTQATFCFDFEDWYTKGYYDGNYVPHSLIYKGNVIANVSANIMDFNMDGELKHFIQIGTVMTDKAYRKQGLGRWLMERVLESYADRDGIYLFGNDSVLEYYPKFGFKTGRQFEYFRKRQDGISSIDITDLGGFKKITEPTQEDRERYFSYIREAAANDRLSMNGFGLLAFWSSDMECTYYSKRLDAYINAEAGKNSLRIIDIIAKHRIGISDILTEIGEECREIVLGFTPFNTDGFESREFKEEDCTYFFIGADLARVERDKLIFSAYTHA